MMPVGAAPARLSFKQYLRRWVEGEIRPRAARWERDGRFPSRVLAECARRGYFSLPPNEGYILAEEIARCDSLGFALSVFVQANLIAPMLEELGTARQKQVCLKPLMSGRNVGCMAVSEPVAGSDFAALETEAKPARGSFVLTGTKTYITNAALADFAIVAGRITGGRPDELSLFLVPLDGRSVRVKPLPVLGLRASAAGTIELRGCRIPGENLLGAAGEAFAYIQRALNRERLFGGIAAVSWAEYAMQRTLTFARSRRAFGQTISRFQAVRHQFADMATRLEAARRLNRATFDRWTAGEDVTREICMIKLFSYQVAQDVIGTCLQLHGGLGYSDDHWASRYYRDARALTIAAGTPEVMRDLIAAYLRV
jgi:acyl-CoA dehydrogenase